MDRYRTVRETRRNNGDRRFRRSRGATQASTQLVRQKVSLVLLIQAVQRHAVILLLGAWLLSLSVAGVAFIGMIKVDRAEQPSPVAAPATQVLPPTASFTKQQAGERQTLPLLSLGAIAFSCAIGCLLLSRRLHPRQPTRRLEFSASSRAGATRRLADSTSPKANSSLQQPSSQTHATNSVPVTVLPPDQSHPLDWDEPSLADSLDIRQKRPLSHWL
jgi:hypothetical protein